MKNKFNSVTTSALVVTMGMLVNTALADKSAGSDSIQTQLSAVAAPELPAQAAQIIAAANAAARPAITGTVIADVFSLKPASLVSVVSAIAQQSPDVAAIAAATAAKLEPKQASWIARAAASAAPGQAISIVTAVCKAVPSQYGAVAVAVAQAVPDASSAILAAVGDAIPTLKPYLDQASATYQGSSVEVVIGEAQRLIEVTLQSSYRSTGPLLTTMSTPGPSATVAPQLTVPLPPPTQKPPITAPPATPGQVSYTNSITVPANGGRDYSGG
jgi:hypothetical protein